jgi:hypothetical protein
MFCDKVGANRGGTEERDHAAERPVGVLAFTTFGASCARQSHRAPFSVS